MRFNVDVTRRRVRAQEHDVGSPSTEKEGLMKRGKTGATSSTRRWKSFILRPESFLFSALLIAVIVALELFRVYSHRNHGYPVPSDGVQVLYKYLPVTVLVFVQYFWQTYDLEIKKLAPWADMRKRAQWAEDSLLLDYVGVNPITVAYRAVRRRHWPVLLSLVGAGLISLCLIVGTSLWVITPQKMAGRPVRLNQTQILSRDSFSNPNGTTYLSQFISDRVFTRKPSLWMRGRDVFAPFELATKDVYVGNITGSTSAYSGQLVCETINIQGQDWFEHKIRSGQDEDETDVMTYRVKALWKGCEKTIDIKTYTKEFYEDPDENYDEDILLLEFAGGVYKLECNSSTTTALIITHFDRLKADGSVGTACNPIYTRRDVDVVVNASSYTFLSSSNKGSTSENVTFKGGDDLLSWFDYSNRREFDGLGNEYGEWFPGWYWGDSGLADAGTVEVGAWGFLIMRVLDLSKGDLMDPTQLASASQSVFRQLFPYIARAAYLVNASAPIKFDGILSTIDDRLVSTDTSILAIELALAVMVVITAVLFWLHPVHDLHRDPAPLASLATILATNPDLEDKFKDTSHMSEERLNVQFRGTYFRTQESDQSVTIVSAGSLVNTNDLIPPGNQPWDPIFLHPVMKIFIILILGGSIATLEYLYMYSDDHSGLAYVAVSRVKRYLWLYTAPSMLFAVGLLIKAFHSVVRATYSYTMLTMRHQSEQALLFNPVFYGPFILIPRSFRRKMFPIAFSALALLTIPAAKIFVAGIFKTGTRDTRTNSKLTLDTKFATLSTSDDSATGVSAEFAVTTLSDWGNIQPPDWTTPEYAVGSIILTGSYSKTHVNLDVRSVPVAKATLENCTVVPYKLQISHTDDWPYYVYTNSSCSTSVFFKQDSFDIATHFAYVVDNKPCSSVMFAYGRKNNGALNTKDRYNMTIMECAPKMVISTADVNFVSDPGSVKIRNVGKLNDQDAKDVVSAGRMASDATFNERLKSPWAPVLMDPTLGTDFNLFFEVMTRKYPHVPLDAYLGSDQLERLVQEGWTMFGALFANRALRIEPEGIDKVNATLRYKTSRVAMDSVPTRLLEGILGVLLLFVAAASILSPRTGVLYKAPFSAGARMSMLAGSKIVAMLRRAPAGQKPEETLRGIHVKLETRGSRAGRIDVVDDRDEEEDSSLSDEKADYMDPWGEDEAIGGRDTPGGGSYTPRRRISEDRNPLLRSGV